MKKLFALFMVVAMLTVAGAAMAADVGGHVPYTPENQGNEGKGNSTTPSVVPVVTQTEVAVRVINVALAATPTFAQTQASAAVVEAVTQVVELVKTALASLFSGVNMTNVQVQTGDNIEQAASNNYVAGDDAGNLAKAQAKLQRAGLIEGQKAIGVLPPVKAKATGFQPLPLPKFPTALYGKAPRIDMGKGGTVGASFTAAAAGDNKVVFLDSKNEQATVIPGENNANGAEPGVLTAVAYVEAGETYEPIILTDVSAAEESNLGVQTQTVAVSEETQARTTSCFSPVVNESVRDAISTKVGDTLVQLPLLAAASDWTLTSEANVYMLAEDLIEVVHLPELVDIADNNAGESYIASVWFSRTPGTDNVGVPQFYTNGVEGESGLVKGTLYKYVLGEVVEITAANAKDEIRQGNSADPDAYLVFKVASSKVTTSEFGAATMNISKPSIVVEATNDEHGDDDNIQGVGGSSGGCAAGSAVLALAVLGTFIVTRKK